MTVSNTKYVKKGIKKIIVFTVALRIKCLGINLTKEAKGTCNGNFNSLEEEIEKDIGRYAWIGIITIGIYY